MAKTLTQEERLDRVVKAFIPEDPQDGTDFDCDFFDAIARLRKGHGHLAYLNIDSVSEGSVNRPGLKINGYVHASYVRKMPKFTAGDKLVVTVAE